MYSINNIIGRGGRHNLILTLQTVRCIAFLEIFMVHTHVLNDVLHGLGGSGVSIFFILSGFLMVYNYFNQNKIKKISFISSLFFSYSKIKKLYILHILCTIAVMIVGFESKDFIYTSFRFILNCLLIQGYFPIQDPSINGVSWFLCPLILGYMVFPFFLKRMENCYSSEKAIFSIILSIIILILVGLSCSNYILQSKPVNQETNWVENITEWALYYHPIIRVFDIIIGFNLGYLFITLKKIPSRCKITCLEGLAFLLVITGCALNAIFNKNLNLGFTHPEIWWTLDLVFLPGSMLLVYSFAFQNGVLSYILTNRFTLFIASISAEAYLIHAVVIHYINSIFYHIPFIENPEIFYNTYGKYVSLTLGFLLTIFASLIYHNLYCRYKWNFTFMKHHRKVYNWTERSK